MSLTLNLPGFGGKSLRRFFPSQHLPPERLHILFFRSRKETLQWHALVWLLFLFFQPVNTVRMLQNTFSLVIIVHVLYSALVSFFFHLLTNWKMHILSVAILQGKECVGGGCLQKLHIFTWAALHARVKQATAQPVGSVTFLLRTLSVLCVILLQAAALYSVFLLSRL